MTNGTFYDSKIRRARKPHQCRECRQPIERGDRYLSYAPGLMTRIPVCLGCAQSITWSDKDIRSDSQTLYYHCEALDLENGQLDIIRQTEA